MATRPVKLPTKALDGPAQQLAFCAPSLSQVGRHQQLAMPRDWMRKWRKFAHQSSPEIPPMINATPLIGKVPTGLIAYSQVASRSGSDYKFIDHVIWKYLVDQYVLRPTIAFFFHSFFSFVLLAFPVSSPNPMSPDLDFKVPNTTRLTIKARTATFKTWLSPP